MSRPGAVPPSSFFSDPPNVPWASRGVARPLFGLFILVGCAAILVGESRVSAERAKLTAVLASERNRILTITSIRRDSRKTQVALQERWLAAPEDRGSAGHEVRMMVAEVTSEGYAYVTEPAGLQEEEAPRAELSRALDVWSSDIDQILTHEAVLAVGRLRQDVEAIDRAADRIVRVNAVAAKAGDERADALGRVQSLLGFAGLVLLAVAGAWWWKTASDLRVAAAERAQTKLSKLMKAQSEFFAALSHELRTPIVTMRSLAHGIRDVSSAGEEVHASADQIAREGTELLAIINNILDAAKLESATVELMIEDVDLHAVLERSLDRCQGLAAGKSLAFRLQVPPNLSSVRGDFVKLQQVFTNLIANAIKFTSEGSVSVRAFEDALDGAVIVEVADTGVGIEKEALRQIWRPFRQADGGISRAYGGTGLGLSIVRAIINLHGGRVDVVSAPGQGSTFSVHLRRAAFEETGSPSRSRKRVEPARAEGA